MISDPGPPAALRLGCRRTRLHNAGLHGKGQECCWAIRIKAGREKQVGAWAAAAGCSAAAVSVCQQHSVPAVYCRIPALPPHMQQVQTIEPLRGVPDALALSIASLPPCPPSWQVVEAIERMPGMLEPLAPSAEGGQPRARTLQTWAPKKSQKVWNPK